LLFFVSGQDNFYTTSIFIRLCRNEIEEIFDSPSVFAFSFIRLFTFMNQIPGDAVYLLLQRDLIFVCSNVRGLPVLSIPLIFALAH
jgi:hypothetical protein